MKIGGVNPRTREVADQFWKSIPHLQTFPADIERAVACSSLPIHIDIIPGLSISYIETWIQEHNFPARLNKDQSELHGFLLAQRGHGIIFVNGMDPLDERRFTIAHELAHFMMDYQLPRAKYLKLFGDNILNVLNGDRMPTVEERLQFIFTDIPSPFLTHTLDQREITSYERTAVWKTEWRTDALAIEILAPFRTVVSRLRKRKIEKKFEPVFRQAASMLVTDFGLPVGIATAYAKHISKSITGGMTLAEEWGIK